MTFSWSGRALDLRSVSRSGFAAQTGGVLWASAVMAAAAVIFGSVHLGLSAQAVILLGGIAMTGAPHGVFDLELLGRAAGGRTQSLFALTALYVAPIALVLVGWRLAPGLTLIAFLVAAAVHFGEDDERGEGAERWRGLHVAARGTGVIVPLVFLHVADVRPWLSELSGRTPASVGLTQELWRPCALGLWAALVLASLTIFLSQARWDRALELAAAAVLFLAAPPLLAFAVYFSTVHAVRHVHLAAKQFGPKPMRARARWIAAWLLPAIAVSAVLLGLIAHAAGVSQAVTQAVRILAALTLPHLVFGPWLEQRASGRRPAGGVPLRPEFALAGPRTLHKPG